MKPILFNTDMVCAILDERKTCTRRVVKFKHGQNPKWTGYIPDGSVLYGSNNIPAAKAPYSPGDILYVRETWQAVYETEYDCDAPDCCVNIRTLIQNFDSIPKVEAGISSEYACASMKPRMKYYVFKASDIAFCSQENMIRWRPSIHMPKEAARLFLRVRNVRVERLQDISKDPPGSKNQVVLEGFHYQCDFIATWQNTMPRKDWPLYGWDANPWVWVIEFERCNKPKDGMKGGDGE